MKLLVLLSLILLNGLFAMAEIALVTAKKARLAKAAEDGDASAIAALKLGENPTGFLSAIQIGITSIGILSGIMGESTLAAPLARWLGFLGLPASATANAATAVVVVAVTYLSIVIGELVPKRLGLLNPELIARLVARPMRVLSFLVTPFVFLLSVSTNCILKILASNTDHTESVTEEEITAMLKQGTEDGIIEHGEQVMVNNLLRLDDRTVGSFMAPRSEVVYLDVTRSPEENLKIILDSEYSRFPVCSGGLETILGVIHAKQVLGSLARNRPLDFSSELEPVRYIPETLSGLGLLEQFRDSGIHMAVVLDEYGGVEGIVTMQDLLEAVTGEFTSGQPEDSMACKREDGSWLFDGTMPISDLKETLYIKRVPEEEKKRYHTISGMMMLLMEKIPQAGDHADWGGWRFEVVDMDRNRIDKVLAYRITGK